MHISIHWFDLSRRNVTYFDFENKLQTLHTIWMKRETGILLRSAFVYTLEMKSKKTNAVCRRRQTTWMDSNSFRLPHTSFHMYSDKATNCMRMSHSTPFDHIHQSTPNIYIVPTDNLCI